MITLLNLHRFNLALLSSYDKIRRFMNGEKLIAANALQEKQWIKITILLNAKPVRIRKSLVQ